MPIYMSDHNSIAIAMKSSIISAEYIWVDGDGGLRSKCRILKTDIDIDHYIVDRNSCSLFPEWNFDGSSTGQASTGSSEIILRPCYSCPDPFRSDYDCQSSYLVLCETYEADRTTPAKNNTRSNANRVFDEKLELEPWFGIEQEYFLRNTDSTLHIAVHGEGKFYCGVGTGNACYRSVAEEHLRCCLYSGLEISGLNGEVGPAQWEYQIGPSVGISAGDQLLISRYILLRVAENKGLTVDWHPKPYSNSNGSGCHTNFSTFDTRKPNGLLHIETVHIPRLEEKHDLHMKNYGTDNSKRMTGTCETAQYEKFSVGRGARDTSIRIGNQTLIEKKGYYEDRRPASNCDPYVVTSLIFATAENIEWHE